MLEFEPPIGLTTKHVGGLFVNRENNIEKKKKFKEKITNENMDTLIKQSGNEI